MKRLCETGLPLNNYFDACANYILEYDLIRQGIIPKNQNSNSNLSFDNQNNKNTINSNNNINNNNNNQNNQNLTHKKKQNINNRVNFDVILKLTLQISPYEIILPLLIKEGDNISFEINGKWSIIYPNTENKKTIIYEQNQIIKSIDTNENNRNINKKNKEGMLIGRTYPKDSFQNVEIEGEYFKIQNGNIIQVDKDCVLFIKFNLNPFIKLGYNGEAILSLSNVQQTSLKEIFTHFGFNFQIPEEDNEKLYPINIIRSNPKKFAEMFIKHRINESENIKNLYEEMINMQPLPLIKYSFSLEKISKNLCDDLCMNNSFSSFNSQGLNLKQRIVSLNNNNEIDPSINVMESITIIKDNYDIYNVITNLLIDELIPTRKNRKILFKKDMLYCGYSNGKHNKFENLFVFNFSSADIIFNSF